jgi:hypothetical protein
MRKALNFAGLALLCMGAILAAPGAILMFAGGAILTKTEFIPWSKDLPTPQD